MKELNKDEYTEGAILEKQDTIGNIQEENYGEIWEKVKPLKQELAAITKGTISEQEIIPGNLKWLSKSYVRQTEGILE